MKKFSLLLALGLSVSAGAQRTIVSMNTGWQFAKETGPDSLRFQPVQLPHTWNIADVMDDEPGYYRGPGIYTKDIVLDNSYEGKQLYLQFEAANQETEVWVNGKSAGTHIGGYDGFQIPISEFVKLGTRNEIKIRVNNRYHPDIAPLSADFTFFGGIYRDLWLVAVEKAHFDMSRNYSGIRITTPLVNQQEAQLESALALQVHSQGNSRFKLEGRLFDEAGKQLTVVSKTIKAKGSGIIDLKLPVVRVKNPKLWSPDSPNLYQMRYSIFDAKSGKLLDQIQMPVGFRWYRFDSNEGFFLNGEPLKLVGTSRHQDFPSMGNALPDSLAIADLLHLKKMGGNFLRIAHYPQDPSVLRACDSLGILTSVEIPIVNEITLSDAFRRNALQMQLNMIRQHGNHPSVIIWCYMNEVLLRPPYGKDKEKETIYLTQLNALASSLDSLTRAEDAERYTMIAHHASYSLYERAGLIKLPMIVGWNLYSGWYGGKLKDFASFLDTFHHRHPDKPMLVSEYGADADPRIRSLQPVRFDKSIEYTVQFHQVYWEAIKTRPFVAAAMIWNLADFNSETRSETMPHINNKGLMTWAREPKDPYYFYQTLLSKAPAIHILGESDRVALANESGNYPLVTIRAASNLDKLNLSLNAKRIGEARCVNGVAEWQVQLSDGDNQIQVSGNGAGNLSASDTRSIHYLRIQKAASLFDAGRSLNLLLGGNRYFTDSRNRLWVPDQKYRAGQWGALGGKAYRMPNNDRLPYGTDKNIRQTNDDPIYQTQQTGIDGYRIDLPAGSFEITLCFAELTGIPSFPLPYNLAEEKQGPAAERRVFNVYVNDSLLIKELNLAQQYGRAVAVDKPFRHEQSEPGTVEIRFEAIEGEPVLNAISIKKIN